jgi:hypothetical protein
MFKQGIPLAAFKADDIEAEANRLKKHGNQVHHESDSNGL